MRTTIKEGTEAAPTARSGGRARTIIAVLLVGAVIAFVYWGSIPDGNILADSLSVPRNGAAAVEVEIDPGDGNLKIGRLAGDEQLLASGTLQYVDNRGIPDRSMNVSNGQVTLTVRGRDTAQRWFSFPWAACNGATEWQIQLNPNVRTDLTAHTDGGNVDLNLAGMAVSRVSTDTGGGNVVVTLPDNASDLNVKASTGAGNVVVQVPSGMAAKVHATSGMGKVAVDPRFSKVDGNTYQSSDFDSAANRVEITASSGAGNVSVETK